MDSHHSLHADYAKPTDGCLECQEEKRLQLEYETERDNLLVDDMIERRHHGEHGKHI